MSGAGLRLQIVLAVCGLMTLAFVPLYFAVASLTRASLFAEQVDAAHAVAHAAAVHAADTGADRAALERIVASDGLASLCVEASPPESGKYVCAGDPKRGEIEERAGAVVARVHVDDRKIRDAPLTRLVAVYMTAFALALAFVVYVALTRLIVKPVEALARATDRVSRGARKLEAPASGARELSELSQSVSAMTARLIADEESLRKKVGELEDAQSQIVRSERMASVGRLAAGMAHEIGNPITAIMGMQELMLAGDATPEESADYVKRMRKETDRVHGILRDLLDFARPETEGMNVGTGPASVTDVMNDVVALLKPQKRLRDVAVDVDGGDALVAIAPERLTQILLNLALNAGDAMEKTKDKTLRMRARVTGNTVRIEIEDTGPGVPESVREKLFLPFVTTKDVGQGTGLGLAVCRGIVEAAKGRIDLDVEYTEGARFVVVLPKA
jgi:signal transduction histidine kinase